MMQHDWEPCQGSNLELTSEQYDMCCCDTSPHKQNARKENSGDAAKWKREKTDADLVMKGK